MGFPLSRILEILPGIWVNISKSGLTTSIGTHSASINIDKRGVTTNAGIPGTWKVPIKGRENPPKGLAAESFDVPA